MQKIPTSFKILYFGDVAISLYWIWMYSGFNLHPPQYLMAISNLVITFGAAKSLLFICSMLVHDRVKQRYDTVILGFVLLYIATMCLLFFCWSTLPIIESVNVSNISPDLYRAMDAQKAIAGL